jgi:undecaprenyl pyrophosphate phosphatase UppP
MSLVFSAAVAVIGVFLGLTADSEMRWFGWLLVLIGVLGVASALLLRGKERPR